MDDVEVLLSLTGLVAFSCVAVAFLSLGAGDKSKKIEQMDVPQDDRID